MELKEIDFGKLILNILRLIIIKPVVLPFKIYKNALISLSNMDAADSEESNLSSDFPLYIWLISIFNAIICITYPLGLIAAIIGGIKSPFSGFSVFLSMIALTYFSPLYLGLIREFAQITLKILLYLKIISKK